MASIACAVAGNDGARVSFLSGLLTFMAETLAPQCDADMLWLLEDELGCYPSVTFLGPVVLVGSTTQDPAKAAPGPVVGAIAWPPTLVSTQQALAAGYQTLRSTPGHKANTAPRQLDDPSSNIVGNSNPIQELRESVSRLSAATQPALINTVAGAETEAVALELHQVSASSAGPFVPFNCDLIAPELMESELFGHEQGAFPGAITAKTGRLALADGGTLFLEHVDQLPPPLQSKLVRFLADGYFEPLGAVATSRVSLRLVTATTVNLEELVAARRFRADLLLALGAIELTLPSLRSRPQDLLALLNSHSARVQAQQGVAIRFTEDALEQLRQYPWPGDTTELKNLVERLSIEYANELIATGELPEKYRCSPAEQNGERNTSLPKIFQSTTLGDPSDLLPINGIDLKSHIASLEQRLIEQALQDSNAVVARAADRLHIRRTTLVEKMRKYGISRAS